MRFESCWKHFRGCTLTLGGHRIGHHWHRAYDHCIASSVSTETACHRIDSCVEGRVGPQPRQCLEHGRRPWTGCRGRMSHLGMLQFAHCYCCGMMQRQKQDR